MNKQSLNKEFEDFVGSFQQKAETMLPIGSWMIHKSSRCYTKVESIDFDAQSWQDYGVMFYVKAWNCLPTEFDFFLSEFDFVDKDRSFMLDDCLLLIENLRKSWIVREFFRFDLLENSVWLDSNHHRFFNNGEAKEYSYDKTDDLVKDLMDCVRGDLGI